MGLYAEHIIGPSVLIFSHIAISRIERSWPLLMLPESIWARVPCFLLKMVVLHHEKLIGHHKYGRLLPLKLISVLNSLIKTHPLRIVQFWFLTDADHRREQDPIICGMSILNVEKGHIVLLYHTHSPLKSLVRLPGFLLEHLVKLFWPNAWFGHLLGDIWLDAVNGLGDRYLILNHIVARAEVVKNLLLRRSLVRLVPTLIVNLHILLSEPTWRNLLEWSNCGRLGCHRCLVWILRLLLGVSVLVLHVILLGWLKLITWLSVLIHLILILGTTCHQILNLLILTQNLRLVAILILSIWHLSIILIKVDATRSIHIDRHHILLLLLVWTFEGRPLNVTAVQWNSASELVCAWILVVEHLWFENILVLFWA